MFNDIVNYVCNMFVYRLTSHVADVNSRSSMSKFLFIQLYIQIMLSTKVLCLITLSWKIYCAGPVYSSRFYSFFLQMDN